MKNSTLNILAALKTARKEQDFSQRELSSITGVPQSHISRIETGNVDLQLSSLIEIARALDLELLVIPRNLVPAVQAIIRNDQNKALHQIENVRQAQKYLNRIRKLNDQLKSIPEIEKDLIYLQRLVGELGNFLIGPDELKRIEAISELVRKATKDPQPKNLIRSAVSELRHIRNSLAHNGFNPPRAARPAYALDDDDNG